MPPRRSASSRNANGANGSVKKEKEVPVVATIDDGDDETEEMEEIELSSDDDASDDECALIVLKRPPVTERTVEEVEVMEDDDIAMCGEGTGSINAKEKDGYVKEYIETEGLAMILSKEYGLILFHLESVWIDGEKFEAGKTRTKLVPGTEVKFFDKTYKGAEYKELSEDSLIHQAVAVWTGERPEHLLKKIQEEEYKKKLEEHRKSFMLYLRGEVFLRAALVRVKCEIAGYLSDNMGIAEHKDENDKKINIFFHTDDVKVFKKDIREYGKPAKQILPVGCLVSVDARRVHISGVKNVEYQAIAVMAGFWPLTPHPTLLPGGQGSVAPMYELPTGTFTFYYMELALEAKLQRKVNQLKEILTKSKGQIQYDWKAVQYIQSREQFIDWKQTMGGNRKPPQKRGPRECLDMFKATTMEEEDLKTEGRTKVTTKQVAERTWYTPEAWEHGGLRIKNEVKDEAGMDLDGATPSKRVKKEAAK
jgi:hypothetical protein